MRFTHTMTSAGSGRGTPASRPPLPVLPPRWQPRISQAVGAYRKEVGRGQRHPPVSLQAKRGDLDAKRGGRHTFSPPTAAFPPNSPPQALHKLLHAEYRGLFIPPLPQKSFIEHKIANDDFLRLRRADLQVEGGGAVGGEGAH